MKNTRKNIILISIDNLRADCIECFSNKGLLKKYNPDFSLLKTPTLNSLAKDGIFFENCFTASSYTTASHASILTGCYPITTGVQEYFKHQMKKDTIFQLLKRQYGDTYETFFCTDFPFILGKHIGFDKAIDSYNVSDEMKIVDSIKKIPDNKNFLALFHFSNVHTPYGISSLKKDRKEFYKKTKLLSKEFGIGFGDVENNLEWPENDRSFEENILRKKYHEAINRIYAKGDYQRLMEMYIEGVAYFDAHRLKNFIDTLKKEGIYKKSIIVLFSDHGERWEKDSHGHHDNVYDDTIRVPLIIIGDGVKRGLKIKKQIRTIDITPTVAKILSIKGDDFDGKNIFPLNLLSSRDAIGEIWSSKNVENIKKIMHKAKDSGKLRISDLKTKGFLWKEYIRTEKYKLVNYYDGNNKKTVVFNIIDGIDQIALRIPSKTINSLQNKLTAYRTVKSENVAMRLQKRKEMAIKKQLESLGYRI